MNEAAIQEYCGQGGCEIHAQAPVMCCNALNCGAAREFSDYLLTLKSNCPLLAANTTATQSL